MPQTGSAETRLIVIRGNSGSGKSALAAAIRAGMPGGAAIIGQDQLRREVLRVRNVPGTPAAAYLGLSARFALDHGFDTVVEGILDEEVYGDMLRALVADHRGTTACYRYSIPFEETLRRHATKPVAASFGEEEMRSWWRESDALHGVAETLIGAEVSLDDALARVLADCDQDALPEKAGAARARGEAPPSLADERDWRTDRVGAALEGRNPTVLAELGAAFAVVGDVQWLPGYALALTKRRGIDRLSDLPRRERIRYLADVDLVATAVENVCRRRDPAFRRVNVEILGNTDAFLHAHVWPRYDWEPDELLGKPVWLYASEHWRNPRHALSAAHDGLRADLAAEIDALRYGEEFQIEM